MKTYLKPPLSRALRLFAVLAIAAQLVLLPTQSVSAAQIVNRSLTLQAGASDGGSKSGGVVNHLFNFTLPAGSNVGSIKFEYCTTAALTCTIPTGLVTTSATAGTQTGATGFTLNATTNGEPYLSRTAALIPVSYTHLTLPTSDLV